MLKDMATYTVILCLCLIVVALAGAVISGLLDIPIISVFFVGGL